MDRLRLGLALAAILPLSGTANATLYCRGNGLIYDHVLKITWLQDVNYTFTSGYAAANQQRKGESAKDNIFGDGRMGCGAAVAWAENLVYQGYDGWRLPMMMDTGTSGCDLAFSGTDCGHNVQAGS